MEQAVHDRAASTLSTQCTGRPAANVCMHIGQPARSSVRIMRAANALIQAGLAVSIVDIEHEATCPPAENLDGIGITHVVMPTWSVPTRFKPWFLLKSARMFRRRVFSLLRSRADVYHAHDGPALLACYVAAQLRRKPLIFEAYELPWSEPYFIRNLHRRVLRAVLVGLLHVMTRRCAGVITVSPPLVFELQHRYGSKKVSLVRNIPEYRVPVKSVRLRHQLGLDSTTRIALYQGNLQPDRALDVLVRAARFLAPDIVIVLLGAGRSQAALEKLIAQEGVGERVKILPPVPQAELLDWTASADIGLAIYPEGYSDNVRMFLPHKLFEYIMAGLPVLASPKEAIVEIIREYGVGRVAETLDAQWLGQAISAMVADKEALSALHRNALDAAQRELRWDIESQRLVALYRDVLGLRPSSDAAMAQLSSVQETYADSNRLVVREAWTSAGGRSHRSIRDLGRYLSALATLVHVKSR